MPEEQHDNLEQFFRKGLRGGDFKYKESDWLLLEKRLDEVDASFRAGFQRGAGLISVLLLIVTGLLIYTLISKDNAVTDLTVESFSGNEPFQSRNYAQSEPFSSEPAQGTGESSRDKEDNIDLSVSERDAYITKMKSQDTDITTSIAVNNYDDDIAEAIVLEPIRPEEPLMPLAYVPYELETMLQPPTGIKSSSSEPQIEHKHTASWLLGIEPEYNTVDASGLDKPSLGIFLGYETGLFRDLWLSTTLTYSRKYYKAEGDAYDPPYYGFWTNGVIPAQATGNCSMLDLAINLRYYLPVWKQAGFYVNTGVTSYILFDEAYQFTYNSNDPGLRQSWSDTETHLYPASNINLGVGYYRSLSKKLDLTLEPYVKIPVSGVGYGDIPITTLGINLGIRSKRIKSVFKN